MKPLNLREYAEALALTDDREFALEILHLIPLESERYEIEQALNAWDGSWYQPFKQIESLGEQAKRLDEIKELLQNHGFEDDPDIEVQMLIETRCKVEEMLQDAGLWREDSLTISVAELIARTPPAFDL